MSPDLTSEDAREQLAQHCRLLYVANYRRFKEQRTGTPCDYGSRPLPQWDGGSGADGRRHSRVWPKLAQFCLERGVNPMELIRSNFRAWENAGYPTPPTPVQLMTEQALARHQEDAPFVREQLEIDLWRQQSAFTSGVTLRIHFSGYSRQSAERITIVDRSRSFTPLFRYCAAMAVGIYDLAERYRANALYEYWFDRQAYDEIWGAVIPPALKQAADQLFAGVGTGRQQ